MSFTVVPSLGLLAVGAYVLK